MKQQNISDKKPSPYFESNANMFLPGQSGINNQNQYQNPTGPPRPTSQQTSQNQQSSANLFQMNPPSPIQNSQNRLSQQQMITPFNNMPQSFQQGQKSPNSNGFSKQMTQSYSPNQKTPLQSNQQPLQSSYSPQMMNSQTNQPSQYNQLNQSNHPSSLPSSQANQPSKSNQPNEQNKPNQSNQPSNQYNQSLTQQNQSSQQNQPSQPKQPNQYNQPSQLNQPSQYNQPQQPNQSNKQNTNINPKEQNPQQQQNLTFDGNKQTIFDNYQNSANMSFQGDQNQGINSVQQKSVNFNIPKSDSSEGRSQQARNMFQSDVRIPPRSGVSPLKGPNMQTSSVPISQTQSKIIGSNDKVLMNLSEVTNPIQPTKSKVLNNQQPTQNSFTKDFELKPDDKLKDVFQEFNRMASLKPLPVGEMSYSDVLPKSLLPSYQGDSHEYNKQNSNSFNNTMPSLSILNRHKSFDIDKFLNKPAIQLITMEKLYKVDLFKQTKLHKQLVELEEQGIKLSKKQQQLVEREQHIYRILSQRRMEYLEYVDFLVPYMLLFQQHIKKEIQDLRQKVTNHVYRPLLVKTRADQEQYFLQRGGYDKWNFENLSVKQQSSLFDGSTLGLMIFASKEVALQDPLDANEAKQHLVNPNPSSSFVHKLKTTQLGIVEKNTLLYGFKLYIFPDQSQQNPENEIRLPVRYLSNHKKPEYNLILRSDDEKQQIEIVSDSDIKTLEWFQEFIRQCTLKQYFYICGRACLCPQRHIIEAIKYGTTTHVKLRMDLNEGDIQDLDPLLEPSNQLFKEVVVSFLTNFFQTIRFKSVLKVLDLSGQRLSSFFLVILFDEIDLGDVKLRLQTLILDFNYVNRSVIDKLSTYLTSTNSSSLEVLSLNYLDIGDEGMGIISQGLVKRHNFLRNTKFQEHLINVKTSNQVLDFDEREKQKKSKQTQQDIYFLNYQIPLLDLRLRNTKITDQGLFHLCQAFEKINDINLKNNGGDPDYTQQMSLDISLNDITENSLRYLGALLTKFNAIKYLNISACYRMTAVYSEYFFECLNQNYSLQILDLSCIKLSQKFLEGLLKMLSNNCTIVEIKLQIDDILAEFLANFQDKALLRLLQLKFSKPIEQELLSN